MLGFTKGSFFYLHCKVRKFEKPTKQRKMENEFEKGKEKQLMDGNNKNSISFFKK